MAKIVLRSDEDKVIVAKNIAFIEVRTNDNRLAGVLFVNEESSRLKVFYPGDIEFARYSKIFNVDAAKSIHVNCDWSERKKERLKKN